MIHQLKTAEPFYTAVVKNKKTFEVRKNDRDFHAGDFLALNCINAKGKENGSCAICEVSYVLNNANFCLPGMVVLGIKDVRILR